MGIANNLNTGQVLKPTSAVQFGNVTLGTGGAFRTDVADTSTAKIQAYDVDGATYIDLITVTAGNTPGFAVNYTPVLDAGVNIDMLAGNHTIGASVGANNLTLGGSTSTIIIPGNLTVQGTTTTIDTTNLDVKDKNILVNFGGTTAGTIGAGINIGGDTGAVVGFFRAGASNNALLEFKAPTGNTMTISVTADKTFTLNSNLNVTGDTAVNQNLQTIDTPTFGGLILTGNVDLTGQETIVNLLDNDATALSLNAVGKTGIIALDTTNGTEGVKMSGYLNIGNTINIVATIDDDSFATATATNIPTSESVKAYVDSRVAFAYITVTGTTQALAIGTGYIMNNAALITGTLPSTAAVGDVIEIIGQGAGGWKVAQNAGQLIHFGDQVTTTGTGGYIASTYRYDNLRLLCITADTEFTVMNSGNISIV